MVVLAGLPAAAAGAPATKPCPDDREARCGSIRVPLLRGVPGGSKDKLRIKFRVWPGQGTLIEGPFRQRVIHALRKLDPDYADWMVSVTYRTAE